MEPLIASVIGVLIVIVAVDYVRAVKATKRDQKEAKYPYCEDGSMNCGDLMCGCVDNDHYRNKFRCARARLRKHND